MRFKVVIAPGAEDDLAEIFAFLSEREGAAMAGKVLEGMLEAIGNLAHFPERGSHPGELLKLGIHEFRQVLFQPYRLIYRLAGNQMLLLVAADGRRDFQSLLERRILRG
jgi:toxin ParE1/3/4